MHPTVISLKEQIEDMKKRRDAVMQEGGSVDKISRARSELEKRSLDSHEISTPTSFAIPPWISASCTLL